MGIHHPGERLSLVEEHVLPLAHVAEVVVVHHDHLHRALVFHDGAKLLYAHLESAVAGEHAHCAFWGAKGGTDGGWQSEAHGAESAAGHYRAFLVVFEVSA